MLCVVLNCIQNPNLTESRWSSFSNQPFFSLFSVLVVNGCDVCCIETLWNWKSGGSDCSTTSLRTQKRNSRYLSQSNTGSRCSKLHFFCFSARNNYDLFRAPPQRRKGFCDSKYVKDALFTTNNNCGNFCRCMMLRFEDSVFTPRTVLY